MLLVENVTVPAVALGDVLRVKRDPAAGLATDAEHQPPGLLLHHQVVAHAVLEHGRRHFCSSAWRSASSTMRRQARSRSASWCAASAALSHAISIRCSAAAWK